MIDVPHLQFEARSNDALVRDRDFAWSDWPWLCALLGDLGQSPSLLLAVLGGSAIDEATASRWGHALTDALDEGCVRIVRRTDSHAEWCVGSHDGVPLRVGEPDYLYIRAAGEWLIQSRGFVARS